MHLNSCRRSNLGTRTSRTLHGNANAVSVQTPTLSPDLLLDTYFARLHGKPYYILDEATTRQRLQANQLPPHLAYAIYALSARYAISIPDNYAG